MDELFLIEKQLGEVTAVVSLTFSKEENTRGDEKSTVYEEFPVSEKPEEAKKILGNGEDDDDEAEAEAAVVEDEGEEGKKPKFNPKDFQWTVTNGCPKNLLTVFSDVKNINALPDLREATSYSERTGDAVTQSLDDFCGRVVEETSSRNLYLQVLFAGQ